MCATYMIYLMYNIYILGGTWCNAINYLNFNDKSNEFLSENYYFIYYTVYTNSTLL